MNAHPARIGKYEVLGVVGRGGMGVVYKASDPQIGRFVAIKMIAGGDLQRFYAEAQSTGNLQCPNIVTVYDLGDLDGNPYLVMEFLEGVSLDFIFTSGRAMNLLEKLRVMIDVCNGLHYAHQRNVIHRDIKPGNIMVLNDGTAKIVDFGIARIGDRRVTKTDQVIGSPDYMSPEQIQSRPLDSGTDIFSAGVVLYQLLTGALPFESAETTATLMKIIHEPPAPLGAHIQNYPPELDQIIGRALAKNRNERYATAHDLAFDLTRMTEQQCQEAVAQFLRSAEAAIERAEWTKAREQLQQILSVDRQHAQAHRLLGNVQINIRKRKRSEQARQLRSQADEAFVDLRYDEALRLLDQAVTQDDDNQQEIHDFRESVRAAKSLAERLQLALRRAEAAHHAGDLEEASQAIRDALALDPNETQAKALERVIKKQVEERERQLQMRKLFDEAQTLLGARKITQALEILKPAELLNPDSLELRTLLKRVHAAREQETRRADLAKLAQQIEEALIREDYTAAAAQAETGLQKYPREQGLLKLKALADTQRKRVEEKTFVRERFTSAHALLELGKASEALSSVEKALQRVPGDAELELLRNLIKERMTLDESEDHLRRSLEAAHCMVAAGDFDQAIQILERSKHEFPDSRDVEDLLAAAETGLANERSLQQLLTSVQNLRLDKDPQRVVQVLEAARQFRSDTRIIELLTRARQELDDHHCGVESAIDQGTRILDRPPNSPRETLTTGKVTRREASATEIIDATSGAPENPDLLSYRSVLRVPEFKASEAATKSSAEIAGHPVFFTRPVGTLALAAIVAAMALGGGILYFRRPAAVRVISSPSAVGSQAQIEIPEKTAPAKSNSKSAEPTPPRYVANGTQLAAERDRIPHSMSQNSMTQKMTAAPSSKPRSPGQIPILPSSPGGRPASNIKPETRTLGIATSQSGDRSRNDAGTQATTTVASNQPPADPKPQPGYESNPGRSIPQPEPISSPEAESLSPSKLTPESEAIRGVLRQYEEAYQSMDIGVMQRVWPSLDKGRIKRLKEGFRGARAVIVHVDCGNIPVPTGDALQLRCAQSMTWTREKQQRPETNPVAILLRKTNGNWFVETVERAQ